MRFREIQEGTRCWKGYERKGMKTMFGKRVPNCVKREEVETEAVGPGGGALGGAIGQILIENSWNNITSKEVFQTSQQDNPFLVSMSLLDQREIVLK